MNSFPTRLTLELAARILTLAGDLRIPVKVDSAYRTSAGNQNCWSKANLTGISGSNLRWRPINGHLIDETAPPQAVKIWQSRLTEKMREIITQAVTESSAKSSIPSPLPKKDTMYTGAKIPRVPNPLTGPTPGTTPLPTSINELLTNAVTAAAPAVPAQPTPTGPSGNSFLDLARHYNETRTKLATEAKENGLQALAKLQKDRDEFMQMVEHIDQEIADLQTLLGQFGVPVPQPTISEPTGELPTVEELMAGVKRTKHHALRTRMIQAMLAPFPSESTRHLELAERTMGYIGDADLSVLMAGVPNDTSISQLMAPFIRLGRIEKERCGRGMKYRIKRKEA